MREGEEESEEKDEREEEDSDEGRARLARPKESLFFTELPTREMVL